MCQLRQFLAIAIRKCSHYADQLEGFKESLGLLEGATRCSSKHGLLAERLPQGGYRIAEFHALDLRDLEREAIVVHVLLYNRAMPNTVVEYGQAIYYPHIRFRNREWLRTSALYHDNLAHRAARVDGC